MTTTNNNTTTNTSRFPSPYGAKCFKYEEAGTYKLISGERFRPLTGQNVSNGLCADVEGAVSE